jgi:hypothetical protein
MARLAPHALPVCSHLLAYGTLAESSCPPRFAYAIETGRSDHYLAPSTHAAVCRGTEFACGQRRTNPISGIVSSSQIVKRLLPEVPGMAALS